MTILEILNAANEGNPDKYLVDYYDTKTGEFDESGSGDTLAEFVVRELIETFVAKDTDEEQIDEAVRVMERAREELENVINALDRLRK